MSFEDEDLYYLVCNCRSLRKLHIQSFSCDGQQVVTDTGLRCLIDLRQSLEEFSVSLFGPSIHEISQEYFVRIAAALVDV